MRRIMVPVFIMLMIATGGLAAGQEDAGPRIAVKELRYDLGKVQQGKQASHVFEFRNSGTETLVIERVQPG